MAYWVYILECANGSYYTGYTSDLERRYQEHLDGINCKYTRSFKPLRIAQNWKFRQDKAFAMKVERFIKKLPKEKKLWLINNPKTLLPLFKKNGKASSSPIAKAKA